MLTTQQKAALMAKAKEIVTAELGAYPSYKMTPYSSSPYPQNAGAAVLSDMRTRDKMNAWWNRAKEVYWQLEAMA